MSEIIVDGVVLDAPAGGGGKSPGFRWRYVIFGGLALVVLVALFFVIRASSTSDVSSLSDLESDIAITSRLESQYQPDRGSYGFGEYLGSRYPISDVFSNLPALPSDFFRYKYEVMTGRASVEDLCGYDSSVYSQPEFFLNNFVDSGLRFYKSPDPNRWIPEGYGTFPSMEKVVTSPGSEFLVCSFTHSSWGVQSYQGFRVGVVYPAVADLVGEGITFRNDSSFFVSAVVLNDSLLLEPSFPRFGVGWVRKVVMRVKVRDDAPIGVFGVGYDLFRAKSVDDVEWSRAYNELYQGKSSFGVSVPQFVVVVDVVGDESLGAG